MEPFHQNRFQHVEHRHGVDLVAANDVHDHHEIGSGNKPAGPCNIGDDVLSDVVAVSPVADDGHWKVADGHHDIGHHHTLPHGYFRRPLLCGRNRCLNLQHHIVPRVSKCHRPQCVECAEHMPRHGLVWQVVICVTSRQWRGAVPKCRWNCPRNR
jgi:hypothetical protein